MVTRIGRNCIACSILNDTKSFRSKTVLYFPFWTTINPGFFFILFTKNWSLFSYSLRSFWLFFLKRQDFLWWFGVDLNSCFVIYGRENRACLRLKVFLPDEVVKLVLVRIWDHVAMCLSLTVLLIKLCFWVHKGLLFKNSLSKLEVIVINLFGILFLYCVVKTAMYLCFLTFRPSNCVPEPPWQLQSINRLLFLHKLVKKILTEWISCKRIKIYSLRFMMSDVFMLRRDTKFFILDSDDIPDFLL